MRLVGTRTVSSDNQSPDTKMAGSLVKAGNSGDNSPQSPSTPGVHDAPAPQPPHSFWKVMQGKSGREGHMQHRTAMAARTLHG